MRRDRLPGDLFDRLWQQVSQYCDTHREVKVGYLFSVPELPPVHRELVAALGNEEEANLFLGQMLWEVLRTRPNERWRFIRPEGGEDHPAGMMYWRET